MKKGFLRTYGIVALLISVAIVGVLVYRSGNVYTKKDRMISTPVSTLERTYALDCQMRIRKIEDAIQMYYAEYGKYPDMLSDLTAIKIDETYCPVSGEAYIYDPNRGTVICPKHRR
ncbi:MAG: hypothetical protein ABIL70_00470 [candidate division WOR-3 bacterium]